MTKSDQSTSASQNSQVGDMLISDITNDVFGVSLMFGMLQWKSKLALGALLDVEIVVDNVLVARKGKFKEEAIEYCDIGQ
ncbi:hypothetical protein AAES_39926 [Amazona aestiva]|uniref:Uncharacterized protein n=1 Tax=Amazona aestiva TaxID=12930 RepID=A0A0Q3MSN5_AMAAE|nr:hypothetical protein AAES_39926 [Amazona aestiva]